MGKLSCKTKKKRDEKKEGRCPEQQQQQPGPQTTGNRAEKDMQCDGWTSDRLTGS